jgi:REP element-mobilizing transposase RayT
LFGAVVNGEMRCNEFGDTAWACWQAIPAHFPHVEIDAFVVMPNHVDGILLIIDTPQSLGATHASPLLQNHNHPNGPEPGSISAIVGSFKSAVTHRIHQRRDTRGAAVWQRSFHDHIIRNQTELNILRLYIYENAAKWAEDTYYWSRPQ